MALEYDEKGKIFTDIITKDRVLSHIQTQTGYIRGHVHVRTDDRLSDELNLDYRFLAVTEAEIYNPNGEMLYSSDFLAVNREHIVWVMPINELQDNPE
jgi:hypothetical protein